MQSVDLPHVLVTGAAGDIGRGLVDCFLSRGHRVLGLDKIELSPSQFLNNVMFDYKCCDLTDPISTARVINNFIQVHGSIQIVINNVGLIHNCPVVSLLNGKLTGHPLEDWDSVIAVTLTTAFHVTTTCVTSMLEKV